MLNSILNGSSRTGSSTASRNNLTRVSSSSSSTTASGYYQGRSGTAADNAVPPSNSGISVVEKKGDNAITVHANGNDYRIENKTAQEFNNETKSYSSAQTEEYAKSISVNQAATNTYTTPPPTDGTTTTPPPTDTGGTTTEEESDKTLMYILIAAIVGVALFPTGKKKKKKK